MLSSILEYDAAAQRFGMMLELQDSGFPSHEYPKLADDMQTIRLYHKHYGAPPRDVVRHVLWRLFRRPKRGGLIWLI